MTQNIKMYIYLLFFAFASCKQTFFLPLKNAETTTKVVRLPFDFSHYYKLCYNDDKKCKKRYPSYASPASDSILSYYGIKETPTEIFILSPYNGFQPIIIAYTDSDIEGYYLFVGKQGKVISSLQIGQMDGETLKNFTITENHEIEIYSRNNSDERRNLIKKYKIQPNGLIE